MHNPIELLDNEAKEANFWLINDRLIPFMCISIVRIHSNTIYTKNFPLS